MEFTHSRHKVDYIVNIKSRKVFISYSDTVTTPKIIFSWDPYPGTGSDFSPSNTQEFLDAVRGCIIILPIGYDRYKL